MKADSKSPGSLSRALRTLSGETGGNQLVEFAVTLPLLLVLAVGIFDFGSAFTVKQKLVGIAQAGARIGANQAATDLTSTSLTCPQLVAICSVRDVVDHALLDNNLKDCGLATTAPASTGNLTWTITGNTGCASALVVKVERSYVYPATLASPFTTTPMQIVATRVTITYPYQWQFNKVIGLLGGSFTGPAQLQTVAVMQNLN